MALIVILDSICISVHSVWNTISEGWDKAKLFGHTKTTAQCRCLSLVCVRSPPKKHEKDPHAHLRSKHGSALDAKVLQFWGFWCLCHWKVRATHSERRGCDRKCGVDCIVEGQNMGNEVVKPYKIITKGEVVSSVVTGSLHDNFLLLENKGVTALHWNILCVWCRDRLGYTYSQGSNVTPCDHLTF